VKKVENVYIDIIKSLKDKHMLQNTQEINRKLFEIELIRVSQIIKKERILEWMQRFQELGYIDFVSDDLIKVKNINVNGVNGENNI